MTVIDATRGWREVPLPKWKRAHNWHFGPISLFRNPDAGYGLSVNGWRLWGPGDCGPRTWDREANRWCHLPFGHLTDHEYATGGIVLAPGESATVYFPILDPSDSAGDYGEPIR